MPRLLEAMKDVISCDKLRGLANTIRSADFRMGEAALAKPEIRELIRTVSPRLSIGGLASSPTGARPAQIMGVDPTAESEFSILDEKVVEGRYLKPDDRLAAFVGSGLAESLELHIGSRLVVTAQDSEREIAGQLVRVVGIFRSGVPEVDHSLIHIPLRTATAWLQTGDGVTGLAVLAEDSRDVPRLSRALGAELGPMVDAGSLKVVGWLEAMPALDAAVKIDDFGNYLFQGILFTIIGLGIVNTVLMSVLHRHREFGVLQALGLTPRQTGGLVMIEGCVLSVVSGAIGIGLGLFITWFFWADGLDLSGLWNADWSFSGVVMDPVIIPKFGLARVIQGLVFVFLIGTLASLYPALRAARIDVAEAMKFER